MIAEMVSNGIAKTLLMISAVYNCIKTSALEHYRFLKKSSKVLGIVEMSIHMKMWNYLVLLVGGNGSNVLQKVLRGQIQSLITGTWLHNPYQRFNTWYRSLEGEPGALDLKPDCTTVKDVILPLPQFRCSFYGPYTLGF